MKFETWAAILSIIATIPVYKGWFYSFLQWNRERKLQSLIKTVEHYTKLKDDQHYLIGWIAQSILLVLALLASALMFEFIAVDPKGEQLSSTFIGLMAVLAYTTSIYKLGQIAKLKDFNKTILSLNKAIEELE